MPTETLQPSAGLKDESQLVTFLLKDEEFGFDIMSVQEIIRLPKMAKVPRTPAYVDGIANLRGVVLPVIDMRTRFGMERAEETDRTRVLVVDIDGVKTGLRVDRVKQVTRVLRSEIEPPPEAIRGTSSDYLEGVVKLDKGQRIVMALNAAHVCEIGVIHTTASANGVASKSESARQELSDKSSSADTEVQKVVTFRIAKEEFAFHMEHVREILRVETPNQVPDVPEYVLGVLTVRGQILPVVDLRRLLQQRSLADEFADSCRPLREEYERWLDQIEKGFAGGITIEGGRLGHRTSPQVAGGNQQFQPITDGGPGEGAGVERKGRQTTSGPNEARRKRGSGFRSRLCRGGPLRGQRGGRRVAEV
jgi:purine-binding chemotaxis protein CheW